MSLRKKLQKHGLAYESTLNPTKSVCNNCGTTVSFDLTKAPEGIIFGMIDTLTGEMLYCPNCGPHDADSIDGVTLEK